MVSDNLFYTYEPVKKVFYDYNQFVLSTGRICLYIIPLIYFSFITLTPISGGGDDCRHDIPDNLKLFFRPVAMVMPDVEVVAGVLLYSMGFNKVFILNAEGKEMILNTSTQVQTILHECYSSSIDNH